MVRPEQQQVAAHVEVSSPLGRELEDATNVPGRAGPGRAGRSMAYFNGRLVESLNHSVSRPPSSTIGNRRQGGFIGMQGEVRT